jgi:glycosyltransferase involved in cell wall biosynthesis
MRILIVSDAWEPQINGVVRTYQHIIPELKAMGHTVEVIGPRQFWSFPLPGYKEIELALFPARKLYRLIDAFNPDSIHIAVEGPLGWAARRYCIKHKKPFTTSFHTQFPDYVAKRAKFLGNFAQRMIRRAAIAFVRYFHARAKCIFVATQSLEEQLIRWRFKRPMVRLVRGADFNVFHPGEKTLFQDLPKPILLYVGRVAVEKSIEDFLSLDLPGTKAVVGDGPARDDLQHRYPDAIFTGSKEGQDLGAHFRSGDVFVYPSKTDTFGKVLIEALASGLPVAAYDVTGPKDIITEPLLGCVGGDLKAAILNTLNAPGTAQDRFAYTQDHYSWRAVAEVFLNAQKSAC